jgi:hypothetical protein
MKSNVNLELVNVEFLKTPVKRGQSELSISRRTLVKGVDKEVKSLSAYFKEFRKSSELKNFLSLAHARGRTFDPDKVHAIVNCGDIKTLLAADEEIQSAKKNPAQNWSGQRVLTAFVAATEIKTPKK